MSSVEHEPVLRKCDSIRILVVEDELIVAMELENKLIKLGYKVPLKVSSGEDAMKAAADVIPDLVMMDITLDGDIDGVEAAKYISETHNIPVIFLTAHSDIQTMHRAKTTEPFGYLIKPYTQRDLMVAIAMAIYKHKIEMKLKVIIEILQVFYSAIPIEEKLTQSIRLIMTIPQLSLSGQGAIYLIDGDTGFLQRKASIGDTECERVLIGECLCGLAAAASDTIFGTNTDERHKLHRDTATHGHYCVPIKTANGLLGVLNLYVCEGGKMNSSDERILTAIADIIANSLVSTRERQ